MLRSIFSLIVIFSSLAFAVFYVRPAYDRAEVRRAEIQENQKAIAEVGEIQKMIAQTTAILQDSQVDIAGLNVFLPQKLDSIRFANDLKYIGIKNNLVLSDIKVEDRGSVEVSRQDEQSQSEEVSALDVSAEQGFVPTKASFSVTTTYQGFRLLLADLERSLGIINITSLAFQEINDAQITTKASVGTPAYYQYSVSLETYSLK